MSENDSTVSSSQAVDQTIVRAAIHPAIGIGRVGNAPDACYIGPQVPDPAPKPEGFYRDSSGALKREAALFRVYGLNAAGEAVRELDADCADIRWTVHLANQKAAWYEFQLALDIPEAAAAPASNRRNAAVKDRSSLIIDPGPRSISGCDESGPGYAFDSGQFMGKTVYLGEVRTDDKGRLIVLGGHGVSASHDGSKATTFANNDGWHDDVSDGPVTATVTLDGRELQVDPAWMVVAPPNYGPNLKSVRTMHDLMLDVAVRAGHAPLPSEASFTRDIQPLLERLSGLQWANKGFAAQFGWGGPNHLISPDWLEKLSSPSNDHKELRLQIANAFRVFERDGYAPMPWPWLYGDAMNVPPVKVARQNAMVTDTQIRLLRLWAAGHFADDYDPFAKPPQSIDDFPMADRPAMLDKAALDFCLADAFHPGCEMTWPMRHASIYQAPFRIRHRPAADKAPNYGSQLTPEVAVSENGPLYAQAPGDICRWMAVPWQTDTASCRSGYNAGYGVRYDPYLPTFWPARVPNQVLTEADYSLVMDQSAPMDRRIAAFSRRASWFRTLGPGGYMAQINTMIDHFDQMGVLETQKGIEDDPNFPPVMQVEVRGPEAPPAPNPEMAMTPMHVEAPQGADTPSDAAVQAVEAAGLEMDEVTVGYIEKVRRFPHGLGN